MLGKKQTNNNNHHHDHSNNNNNNNNNNNFIDLVLSWFVKSYKSCLSFPCNLIGYFKQAFKSEWLLCFDKDFYWLRKRCDLVQKK